jgi:ATP-dependent Clp protease adapter protein ClpS
MNKKQSDSNINPEHQNAQGNTPFSDARLILYNDDVNEFSYVVNCIIEILDCTDQQAEQLTLLAHYKGSATVKEGPEDYLAKLSALLKDKGLKSAVLKNDQK